MPDKRLPVGICDHCEGPIPPGDWYTRRGPRLYCSVDCRNTANSRNGNPVRTAKLRQAVAEGHWQNPHHLHPPTSAEQSARSRKGRLREVAEGRWRNPALSVEARAKLSRPRKYGADPLLHRAIEKLDHGKMADLTPEEHARYLAYERERRQARLPEIRAYQRARYHRIMAAADPAARERLRALWRRHAERQRRAQQLREKALLQPIEC